MPHTKAVKSWGPVAVGNPPQCLHKGTDPVKGHMESPDLALDWLILNLVTGTIVRKTVHRDASCGRRSGQ